MADFNLAIKTVLAHEGKLSQDEVDTGGITNFGISLKFLKGYAAISKQHFDIADINDDNVIDDLDIKNLSIGEATYLYRQMFWDKNNLDNFTYQPLATKVFDICVNIGSIQGVVLLQRAVRAVSGVTLKEDGVLGPKTMSAVITANYFEMLSSIKSEAAGFYRLLVFEKPQYKKYLTGWLNRAYS